MPRKLALKPGDYVTWHKGVYRIKRISDYTIYKAEYPHLNYENKEILQQIGINRGIKINSMTKLIKAIPKIDKRWIHLKISKKFYRDMIKYVQKCEDERQANLT